MIVANEAYKLSLTYAPEQPVPVQRLTACKNTTAAFQLILSSDRAYSVHTGLLDWHSAGTQRFTGKRERLRPVVKCAYPVKMYIEGFMTDDDNIRKADILLHQDSLESDAAFPTAVWAEIELPEDAEPGSFPVEVLLYASLYDEDEQIAARASLTLDVIDYAMPSPKDYSFYLDLWQHPSNIARRHDVPLFSDAHFEVLKKYAQTLAALGQKAITIVASDRPWSGQDCWRDLSFNSNLFEYSMVRITKNLDSYEFDFSAMQRYIDICTEAGMGGDIEVYGLINIWSDSPLCPDHVEPISLRYLDLADGCMKFVREGAVLRRYIQALEQYFIETDQIQRVRIAADEPGDVEKFRKSLNLIQSLAPRFRYQTAINHAEFIQEFKEQMDCAAPYLRCSIMEYDQLMAFHRENPEKKLLWYVCCGKSWPNTFLCSPLIESRLIGILTYILGFDGFLRWAYTEFTDDPRREIRYSMFEAGDANFVYPAYNGDVLLTLRWKNLKRGVEDYELIRAASALIGEEKVRAMLRKVFLPDDMRSIYSENREIAREEIFAYDWQAYDELRGDLLRLLAGR